jgi:formamidopyrimidine-DNA glycosylase
MPELPEVETFVRALRRPLLGRTFTGARNDWPRLIVTPTPAELDARIAGRRVEAIDRRGKYLVLTLSDDETLILHLKMSGHLSVVPAGEPADPHVHTVFPLDDGRELRFLDTRKFGRVYLVRDPAEVLGPLGPEPLADDFTAEAFTRRLRARRRVLKPLLLDQTFLAGVGNIYADEALHLAGILPWRVSHTLSDDEAAALHAAVRRVLELGIERQGASVRTYYKPDGTRGEMQDEFAVYGRAGLPCLRCGTPVERVVLGGRATHYCPRCQR